MDNDELKQEEQTSAPEEKHSPKAEGKKEKSRISELEKEVEKLTSERDKAKETMLRNLAELENFRKRTAREKEDILKYSNTKLLEHFLEIPDTLSAATIQGRKSTDYAALLKGLDERIRMETSLPVHVADDPLTAVVRGAGKAIDNMNKYSKVFIRKRTY